MHERAPRILIVDDTPGIAAAAARLLQRAGYRTAIAHSVDEAVAQWGTFDLLLVDIQLPNGSVEDIAQAFPHTPLLTMSGYPGAQLDKPFTRASLLGAVDAVLISRWEAKMARQSLSHTLRNLPAVQARALIPPHKRKGQVLRTLAGGAIFAAGLFAPMPGDVPWKARVAIAGFGAFMASQQLVTDYLKAIPQAIGAIMAAFGKKDSP